MHHMLLVKVPNFS